ncbi:MAG: hypothetical protein HYT94_04670 [Parcubacteria group bacterium]|nr:hypothetical protein [Parcubacteria group bacterium]
MKPGLDGFNLTTEYQGEWGITFGGNSLPDNFVWDGKLLNPTTVIFPTKVCRVRVTFKDRDSNTQDHILIASDKWGKEVAKAAVRKNGMSALPTVLTVKNANIWYVDVKHVPDGEVQLLAISYKTKM